MKSRPVIITTANGVSTPAKRRLFRIALAITMVSAIAVSTILILQGGFELSRLRYFVDIGLHRLHITSTLLLFLGLLSLIAFITLTIGLAKINKTLAVIAAILLGICSLGLIASTIWSFVTISNEDLPASINSTITKELDKTHFNNTNFVVENTPLMAKLEKQYQCCGLTEPIEDYQSRQQGAFRSLNPTTPSTGGSRGRTTTQRNTGTSATNTQLPISCCNQNYLSTDNMCIDMPENNKLLADRYNLEGCYNAVVRHKFERIQKQGFITAVAACLAVISCIALTVVIRLLGEGYQIVPVRTTTIATT